MDQALAQHHDGRRYGRGRLPIRLRTRLRRTSCRQILGDRYHRLAPVFPPDPPSPLSPKATADKRHQRLSGGHDLPAVASERRRVRDGIKSVVKQGVCKEADPGSAKRSAGAYWPYDIRKFTSKPPKTCYTEALNHQVVSYQRVTQSLNHPPTPRFRRGLRLRLRDERLAVWRLPRRSFRTKAGPGIRLFSASRCTRVLSRARLPRPARCRCPGAAKPCSAVMRSRRLVLRSRCGEEGGSATLLRARLRRAGNDADQRFIVCYSAKSAKASFATKHERNSWGSKWGKKGYCLALHSLVRSGVHAVCLPDRSRLGRRFLDHPHGRGCNRNAALTPTS